MSADGAATRAGGAVTGPEESKKPGRDHKTIVISKDAYDTLTRQAELEGSDRKTLASKAITTYTIEDEVLNGLQRAISENQDLAEDIQAVLREKLKPGTPELSVAELGQIAHAQKEIAQAFRETAHARKELASIRPARSTCERISTSWIDDCYPPEQSRKQLKGDDSMPVGGEKEE
jgi:exonuclease V gamma subunit